MAETLERVGYECVVATSGRAGASLIAQDEFDVILTDLKMADLDGLAIVRKAKEDLPEAEVVVITGFGDVKTAVEAIKQGASNYLTKPVDRDELRAIVEKAARRVRAGPRQPRTADASSTRSSASKASSATARGCTTCIKKLQGHRPDQRDRPDPGRNRHRQGAGGQGHPQQQPAQEQAVRRAELHGPEREPARRRAFRPRSRRVHRRRPAAQGPLRSTPTAARFSSTKSATCRCRCRRSCCASWKTTRSSGSAATSRSR